MNKTASRLYTIFFGIVILFFSSIYQIPGGIRINILIYPQVGIYALLGFFHAFNMMRFKSWNYKFNSVKTSKKHISDAEISEYSAEKLASGNFENGKLSAYEVLDLISDWFLYTAWYNVILFPLSGFGVIEWAGVFVILICGFISDLTGTTFAEESVEAVSDDNAVSDGNAVSAADAVASNENTALPAPDKNAGTSADGAVSNEKVVNTADVPVPCNNAVSTARDNVSNGNAEGSAPGKNLQKTSAGQKIAGTVAFLGQSPMMLLITGSALYIFKIAVFYLLPANLYLEAFHGNSLARTMIVFFCLLGITALFSLLKKNMKATLTQKQQEEIKNTAAKIAKKTASGIKKFFSKLGKMISAKAFFIFCIIAVFAVILIAGAFALNIYNKILQFVEPFMENLMKNGKTLIIPTKLYGLCQTISLVAILFSASLTAHNISKQGRNI
jgi:hypothetical protein